MICIHLNYVELAALALTCRSLRLTASIYRQKVLEARTKKSVLLADLMEIEKWETYTSPAILMTFTRTKKPMHKTGIAIEENKDQGEEPLPIAGRDFFTCRYCFKIRCASKFANSMMTGKKAKSYVPKPPPHPNTGRPVAPDDADYELYLMWMDTNDYYHYRCQEGLGKNFTLGPVRDICWDERIGRRRHVKYPSENNKFFRMCIDCGMKYGRYRPGDMFAYGGAEISDTFGGGEGIICPYCHRFCRLTPKKTKGHRRRDAVGCC